MIDKTTAAYAEAEIRADLYRRRGEIQQYIDNGGAYDEEIEEYNRIAKYLDRGGEILELLVTD